MCQNCPQPQGFLAELIDSGLLIDTGVDGLYGRSGLFEEVIARFDDLITRHGGQDGAEIVRFPPAMSRKHFEKSGYLKSFPQPPAPCIPLPATSVPMPSCCTMWLTASTGPTGRSRPRSC